MMASSEVRAAFQKHWAERCQDVPAYKNDLSAKRMAFDCFIEDLERDDQISTSMAQRLMLEGWK